MLHSFKKNRHGLLALFCAVPFDCVCFLYLFASGCFLLNLQSLGALAFYRSSDESRSSDDIISLGSCHSILKYFKWPTIMLKGARDGNVLMFAFLT